ncbi:MAG: hypothetical protein ACLGPL_12535 [Acidobacteriota bacterium]
MGGIASYDFGYVFCSVARFYGMAYRDILDLPLYTFWEMAKNADRIRAEEDKRLLVVVANAFAGAPAKLFERLSREQGEVATGRASAPAMDRAGFEALRAMLGGFAPVE